MRFLGVLLIKNIKNFKVLAVYAHKNEIKHSFLFTGIEFAFDIHIFLEIS
jgi:hypothetical protein